MITNIGYRADIGFGANENGDLAKRRAFIKIMNELCEKEYEGRAKDSAPVEEELELNEAQQRIAAPIEARYMGLENYETVTPDLVENQKRENAREIILDEAGIDILTIQALPSASDCSGLNDSPFIEMAGAKLRAYHINQLLEANHIAQEKKQGIEDVTSKERVDFFLAFDVDDDKVDERYDVVEAIEEKADDIFLKIEAKNLGMGITLPDREMPEEEIDEEYGKIEEAIKQRKAELLDEIKKAVKFQIGGRFSCNA